MTTPCTEGEFSRALSDNRDFSIRQSEGTVCGQVPTPEEVRAAYWASEAEYQECKREWDREIALDMAMDAREQQTEESQ